MKEIYCSILEKKFLVIIYLNALQRLMLAVRKFPNKNLLVLNAFVQRLNIAT